MLAEEMQAEAIQRANSEEGMNHLIHALLNYNFDSTLSSLEKLLFEHVKDYVRLKRELQIYKMFCERIWKNDRSFHQGHDPATLYSRYFSPIFVDADQVKDARDKYQSVERSLIAEVGQERVLQLKKTWGQRFSLRSMRANQCTV